MVWHFASAIHVNYGCFMYSETELLYCFQSDLWPTLYGFGNECKWVAGT